MAAFVPTSLSGNRLLGSILSSTVQRQCVVSCNAIQTRHRHSRRKLHSSFPKGHNAISALTTPPTIAIETTSLSPNKSNPSTLQNIPLSQVLRTYLVTSLSSSPVLFDTASSLLRRMITSNNAALNVESNPILRAILWETFYKQFCAGETAVQVAHTCAALRQQGYSGVILEYALEVLKDAEASDEAEDIAVWRRGMLDSIQLAAEGDFVALKWSGMGPAALRRMIANDGPSRGMDEAMHTVCKTAAARNIALLPSAEETWSLEGYHTWCLNLQREYNTQGKSVLYSTYQTYLRQASGTLSQHLAIAEAEGFTLGVKLVRGAYLYSEERSLIHPTVEATHAAFDGMTAAMIKREYNETLKPQSTSSSQILPPVNVVLATHNAESVRKAQTLRNEQAARGESLTPLAFAQLQGMADEVSHSLLNACRQDRTSSPGVAEKVYKFTNWGTMPQCLNYLLRRAAENKDAAGRTKETRDAMQKEIGRRMWALLGMV